MSLPYIGQQLTIYIGSFLFVTGVTGNLMNVWVFSSIRSYRQTPCTFYFLLSSIANLIYIIMNLTSLILNACLNVDLTRLSIPWCKTRQFSLYTFNIISLTCLCLATIDHFFTTSQNATLRRLSNIKWAHRIGCIVVVIWCLHGSGPLAFSSISPITKTCLILNADFAIYASVFVLSFFCVIPSLVMLTFGYLTYRNIHLTRVLAGQHADRQLSRMIFVQVFLIVISIIPYGAYNVYRLITSGMGKDASRLQLEGFIATVLNISAYGYITEGCYMFLISSNRFRHAVKTRLVFWRRQNQIDPIILISGRRQPLTETIHRNATGLNSSVRNNYRS